MPVCDVARVTGKEPPLACAFGCVLGGCLERHKVAELKQEFKAITSPHKWRFKKQC